MIYVRSRKSIVTLGASSLLCALLFGVLTVVAVGLPEAEGWVAGIALGAGALGASAVGLTIRLRNEQPFGFKPAHFGLEPAACRDLILRLRDDAGLRSRLPEFDSARDLAISPIVSGELIKPGL